MDRELKIESRKRGSAQRNVQVQDFNIGVDSISGHGTNSDKENPYINDDFALETNENVTDVTFGRGGYRAGDEGDRRSRSYINRPNEDVSTPINISPTLYDNYPIDTFNDGSFGNLKGDEFLIKPDPDFGNRNASLQESEDVQPRRNKRKRGPRNEESTKPERTPGSRRRPRRKAQALKIKESFSETEYENSSDNDSDFIYTRIDDSQENIAIKGTRSTQRLGNSSNNRSQSQRSISVPIPLTGVINGKRQKALTINIERFVASSKKEKRPILNTIDVLKQVIEDFTPAKLGSDQIEEDQLQLTYKTHVLDHLNYLSDMNLSLAELSSKIREVKKLKNDYRSRTFELKKDHMKVGDELNSLRHEYKSNQLKAEHFDAAHSQIKEMRNMISGQQSIIDSPENASNKVINNSALRSTVDNRISTLGKVANPHFGIFKKIRQINNRLSELETHLS